MLIFRFILLVWMSTRTGLHASVVNKHIICATKHIPAAALFTHCLKRLSAAPAPQSALIGQITLL